ncbi:hypothetical protein TTHERM_00034960 (macronuclear) [Tetrahymena thermophila SB210]|uniref:Uncharacterized protein n=1 Tax=Tetrahymena thermophila (strain SB210) TaxID=312017 RepID=Q22MM3_TETTS|nr:hypothetical protein TTHERM_00034960 [Tetrahymena thermophila SB210]EAR86594.2 hypothetical protein TTHERM_00034960 [Tetrahymena thermophila SB210]|eukprot:XP_976997.2 hypothetical protein TTHERM_00034960 [Tetrahymena thermophila SB210]
MNLTPQPRKSKWYERARPSTVFGNQSVSPIRTSKENNHIYESNSHLIQNSNASEILSSSIHSVQNFNQDFIIPQSINLSQINQISNNNSQNNSMLQSQSILFKSQNLQSQLDKSRLQKTPDQLKTAKRGLRSISDIDDKQSTKKKPISISQIRRNRLLDLVVTKNYELVRMATLKQAFRQIKKNYNKYQIYTIAFNKLHRVIRIHPFEMMSFALKKIQFYEPDTHQTLLKYSKKKPISEKIQITVTQYDEEKGRLANRCNEDLQQYLNLYETPQQKIPSKQFIKAFGCMKIASIQQLIEDKQFKQKAIFFIKLASQYSSCTRIPLIEQNGYSARKTQSKSPITTSRAVEKTNTQINSSNNLIPSIVNQQKWRPSTQVLARINKSLLGSSILLDKKGSIFIDPLKKQKEQNNIQISEQSSQSEQNDQSSTPLSSMSSTRFVLQSNQDSQQDSYQNSENKKLKFQLKKASPQQILQETFRKSSNRNDKQFSRILSEFYYKKMSQYFIAIKNYQRVCTSPIKSSYVPSNKFTTNNSNLSPNSKLLERSFEQRKSFQFNSPSFKNCNSSYNNSHQNNLDTANFHRISLNPVQFLRQAEEAGIRQTVSYLENNNTRNQLFESIDLNKQFSQNTVVWRPFQQEQDSIVEQQLVSVQSPITNNLNQMRNQFFQVQKVEEQEESHKVKQIEQKKDKKPLIYEEKNQIRNEVQEELRNRRISKGMDRLIETLLKKKEMKMIKYIDIYVKYELVCYMASRVVNSVRIRNLVGAFMKISSYGNSKFNKKEKIDRMFYHLDCQLHQKKRSAFFQIQRAAIDNKALQTQVRSLLIFIQNKEYQNKKTAFNNLRSLYTVSRNFVKGKFSQYHFLAMKLQDVFRKIAERKKRECLNSLYKLNMQLENCNNKKNFLLKKVFCNLIKTRIQQAFSQIQISSKQIYLANARKRAAILTINSLLRNKQKHYLKSAFLSLNQEQQIQKNKEIIKKLSESGAKKYEQSKSLNNKAIAYRIQGVLQKLFQNRKQDAFRKLFQIKQKRNDLQQKRLGKLSEIFVKIFNNRQQKLQSDAFNQIKWACKNTFVKRRLAASLFSNFFQKKLKENVNFAITYLKSNRLVDAYQSKQRKIQSKSFYLMLSVKLKAVFDNRKKQNISYGFTYIKNEIKKQKLIQNMSELINKIILRDGVEILKQNDKKIQTIQKAVKNMQKMKDFTEKENFNFFWNKLLRIKQIDKQNANKMLVIFMVLQNIFNKQKRNALFSIQKQSKNAEIRQKASRKLGFKLFMLERRLLVDSFIKIKQYSEAKTKTIRRLVSILRVPYYNLIKQSFETIRDYDLDTYQDIKQSNQFVAQQIQTFIEQDNRYVSPLSKREIMQQQNELNQVDPTLQQANRSSFSQIQNYQQQGMQQIIPSPSTDRTIKLNTSTPFRLSTIKIQQPILISQEEMAQRLRQRYSYLANILNRKSKLGLKRLIQNAFEQINLVSQQRSSLMQIVSNISIRQQQEYLSYAFNQMKELSSQKRKAQQFVSKLAKILKNGILLPNYLHFINILKENQMSKIYVETYQNLEISQAKKRAIQASQKQGEIQVMNEVLQSMNDLNNKQKQLYTRVVYLVENAALEAKKQAFKQLKLINYSTKLDKFASVLNKFQQQNQIYNLSCALNQIRQVGNIYYKSKALTIFCLKLQLISSKKILQQKYEGLFSISEYSASVLEKRNYKEIKRNALGKILTKQRQKHLFQSFFLWRKMTKEYNMKKSLEQESVNNDLYFEVMSFLNQRKSFEIAIDSELKKIQNTAFKMPLLESDKKNTFKGLSSSKKETNLVNSNFKLNSAYKENDRSRSIKTQSSSLNVTSFYPESSGQNQNEKKYDSGDYIMDSYHIQLQSQKKQLYNQFINPSKVFSPQENEIDNNNNYLNNNLQFIPSGIPIIEEDDDHQTNQLTNQNANNLKSFDEQHIDKINAEKVNDFSFTEQEHCKY